MEFLGYKKIINIRTNHKDRGQKNSPHMWRRNRHLHINIISPKKFNLVTGGSILTFVMNKNES